MTVLREVVICEPLRTPVGRFGGSLATVSALTLATRVIEELMVRTRLEAESIDDVIFGQGYPSSEAAPIARVAALDARLPVTVGGYQVDRRCGSGLQAVLDAAMQIQVGASELVIAGGVESMSNAPLYTVDGRHGFSGAGLMLHDALGRGRVRAGGRLFPTPGGMVETAENLRRDYGIPRQEQDELALRSHQRAVAAQRAGLFDEEMVPVTVSGRKGDVVVDIDEHPRADSSLDVLAALRPVTKGDADATVTAGNSSGQNDAAAACIVTTPRHAAQLGLVPLVRLVSWARAGVDPTRMGLGSVPASALALARAGLTLKDVDLIELNEAFAAQVLAVTREWRFGDDDWDRVNVNGGGISLGHPIGATGVRILAGLARQLQRTGGRFALETMCIGGGQGLAAVFERV